MFSSLFSTPAEDVGFTTPDNKPEGVFQRLNAELNKLQTDLDQLSKKERDIRLTKTDALVDEILAEKKQMITGQMTAKKEKTRLQKKHHNEKVASLALQRAANQ